MYEYTEHNPINDVVLTPKTGLRGKRNAMFKDGKLTATVYTDTGKHADDYSMPSLSLQVERTWSDGTAYEDAILSVAFQRTRIRPGVEGSEYHVAASGFLDGKDGKKWSQSYAGRIEARLQNANMLEAGLGILARARESLRDRAVVRLAAGSCELLTLIVGLQRIGVVVTIRNGKPLTSPNRAPAQYQLTE